MKFISLAERIRRINSEQQYEAYLAEIDALLTDPSVEAQERLEVLAILVEVLDVIFEGIAARPF